MKKITIIPSQIRALLSAYLTKQNIEFRMISPDDLPDGSPCSCTFMGKKYTDTIYGVETTLSSEEVIGICECLRTGRIKP